MDAIEVFNSRCFPPVYNRQAAEFAVAHSLDGTVGSDAHALYEVGRSTMLLPNFQDTESLKASLTKAKNETKLSGPWVRFSSRYAVLRKKIGS